MHRTLGDGYITDLDGKNLYADEDPPYRDATQVRHQEMNAIQEEICNVVGWDGTPMNPDSETPLQAEQLNVAIDAKDQEVINELESEIAALTANNIINDSNVTGSKVKDALNNLFLSIGTGINSNELTNISLISRVQSPNLQATQIMTDNTIMSTVSFTHRITGKLYSVNFWETRKIMENDGVLFSDFDNFIYSSGPIGGVLNLNSKTPIPGMHLTLYAILVCNGSSPSQKAIIAIPGDELFDDTHRTELINITGDPSFTVYDVMAVNIGFVQLVEFKSVTGKYAVDPFRIVKGKMEILNNYIDPDYDEGKYLSKLGLPYKDYSSPGEFSIFKDNKIGYIFPPLDIYPYMGSISVIFSLSVRVQLPANYFSGYLRFKLTNEWVKFSSSIQYSDNINKDYESFEMNNPQSVMQYCCKAGTTNNYGSLLLAPRFLILNSYGVQY